MRLGRMSGVGVALVSALMLLQTRCGSSTDDGPVPQGDTSSCEADADCGGGEQCRDGACVPLNGTEVLSCTSDADCGGEMICLNEVCTEPNTNPPDARACGVDEDCLGGEKCEDGFCEPDEDLQMQGGSLCVSDTDCAGGEACDGGRCKPHGGGGGNGGPG